MADYYSYTYDGSGLRHVERKGDIVDQITRIDIEETPMVSTFGWRVVGDIDPARIEDALATLNAENFHAENAVAPAVTDTQRSKVYNYTQNLMITAAVSDTQNAVRQYGIPAGGELAYQEAMKQVQLKLSMEASIVSDQAKQAPTTANSNTGKMDGMGTIISTSTTVVGSFDQTHYDTMIATITAAGGRPTDAYMDATRKIAVDAWTTTPTRFTTAIKTLEKEVQVYHSSLGGDVRMHFHHLLPQDITASAPHFLLIDPRFWEICVLPTKGDRIRRKDLTDHGAGPSTLFKTQICVLGFHEEANGQFY